MAEGEVMVLREGQPMAAKDRQAASVQDRGNPRGGAAPASVQKRSTAELQRSAAGDIGPDGVADD